jgi:5-methylcytosine-specific restriction endonuclease McrA
VGEASVLYVKPLDKLVEATITLETGGSKEQKKETGMSKVFVVDASKRPLDPVHPGRARTLLSSGKAAVLQRYPFTIVLKARIERPQVQPLRLKIDPGSQTTGLALVNDASGEVVFAAELMHRGQTIKQALDQRRAVRRNRRQRKTRYRKPRFTNRRRKGGWLAPSLESRVANVLTWGKRLMKICPLVAISLELVKFDLQAMEKPEISGVEYQQGTLFGYEIRQYLLDKWDRACSYCGSKEVPLQVEHIQAKANGGTNRVSNLCLACDRCNKAKGTQDIRVFLADKPDVLARVLAQAKASLKDATAVNTTRWALYERLLTLGFPLECGSGGLTKFNRTERALPKEHWLDAVCVGKSTPEQLKIAGITPLLITAMGHGNRQKCNVTRIGFPCSKPKGAKKVKGFQTGDIIRAIVTTGSKQGIYVGRVLVRISGSFDIQTRAGRVQGINHRFCTPVHRCDGYGYQKGVPYAQKSPTQAA